MPWMLGLIWVADESGRAAVSLGLSLLVPSRPAPGRETTLWRRRVAHQPAG